MSGLVSLTLALALFIACIPLFTNRTARLAYFTVSTGFLFWYWLPAANLLTVGYIGVAFFQITPSVADACLYVLVAQFATLTCLFAVRPLLVEQPYDGVPMIAPSLGIWALASAVLFLVVRFATEGTEVLVEFALGMTSAREERDFSNLSASAMTSLLGLWESAGFWLALFAFGRAMFERKIATLNGAAALAALTVLFVASGTRAVLLQTILVAVLALLGRPAPLVPARINPLQVLVWFIAALGLFGLIGSALASRFTADTGYRSAGALAVVADTLVVNNDMMREMSFVLDSMRARIYEVGDFVLVPFSHMFPSFLGFTKNIPGHLLAYNELRVGIDLNTEEGNVFPGLVADFWLNFGFAGLFLCGLFIALSVLAIAALRLVGATSVDRFAYYAVGLSFVFFNYRNIVGAFVLSLVLGAVVLLLLRSTAAARAALSPGRGQGGGVEFRGESF